MAEEVLKELEAAAQIVLAPPNLVSAQQRQSAENVFLNFHKTRTPYQLCRQIFELSTTDYVLFETAGLLKKGLIQEWPVLSEFDISSWRQYLLYYVVNKPTLAPYVRAKILQVIAIIIKRGCVSDLGVGRAQVLDEIESLIINGDLPKKILGCNLLSAILQEYANSNKSADIGLTWEVHFSEKKQFECKDLKRIFKFIVQVLGELAKKNFEQSFKEEDIESTLSLAKHLFAITESILVWRYVYGMNWPKRVLGAFELVQESGSPPVLRLSLNWHDVMLDPALLDLFFTLYWKVYNNPQLAHHVRNCLVQLASLNGKVLSSEEEKLQYLTNYMQRFLKLLSKSEYKDEEVSSFAKIIKKINTHFRGSISVLPPDMLKAYREKMVSFTCYLISSTQRVLEENNVDEECFNREALENMLETWICIMPITTILPTEFCKQSSIKIFDTYVRCHISNPEILDSFNCGDNSKEEINIEEDDKKEFRDQLQIIGTLARQVPNYSLPLLAELLEYRIHKLRHDLDEWVVQNRYRPSRMDVIYDDLHWLILIAGHVLCIDSEGEVELIPSELTRCSMQQIQDRSVDVNHTLEFLVSSQNVQSDISNSTDSIDYIIRIIADVFRLCTIEKTAISIHVENTLSPELSNTIIWFLNKWSKVYLLPNEIYYSQISTTILQAFGEGSPGADWTMNFLLEKIVCNINTFKSEPELIKETIKLLITLTATERKAACLLKSEQFTYIMELATKGQYDVPRIIKRGLMRALVQTGIAVQGVQGANAEQYFWSQTLESLQNRYKQLTCSDNFMLSYHQEEIKVQIIDILESFIGVATVHFAQRAHSRLADPMYRYTSPILIELPRLLFLYHNYQNIVQLILELFSEYTKNILTVHFLGQTECAHVYEICLQMIQMYVRCNSNRLTTESTAEEDSYHDILLLMQLLTNLLSKDGLSSEMPFHLGANAFAVENPPVYITEPVDVFLCGLNMIMPMITTNLLQFPSLCLSYYKMIAYVCGMYPKPVCALPTKQLQDLLTSIVTGLYAYGHEVTGLCCDILQALARYIYTEIGKGQPCNDIMAPFLNLLMNLILSHQLDSTQVSGSLIYYLICCYQEQYRQLLQSILSSQTDQQIVQRLAKAFTELTENIDLNAGLYEHTQKNIYKFKENFDKFIVDVQGFLTIK